MKKAIASSLVLIFGISFIITFFVHGEEYHSELETTIVIDPGHGGIDPGSHRQGVLEKNINLAIAKKLASFLERGSINVIMTRTEDELYKDDRNQDIAHRAKIINQEEVDLAVSIHVNSFSQPQISGGQTFYKADSPKSKELATHIQTEIKKLQPDNHRQSQESYYYLLKKSQVPITLTEVGFISNPQERAQLTDPEFQEKMAQAIGRGVMVYLNNNLDSPPSQPTLAGG